MLTLPIPILAELPTPTPDALRDWLVCAAAVYILYAKWVEVQANKARAGLGKAADPMHLKQPLEVHASKEFAERQELEALRAELRILREENTSQHADAKKAGEARVKEISQVVDKDREKLEARIDRHHEVVLNKMDQMAQQMYGRINDQDNRLVRLETLNEIEPD